MSFWMYAVFLVVDAVVIVGMVRYAERAYRRAEQRPAGYRGRHRAAYLDIERLDEAAIIAEVDQGLAAIDALLEEQSR